MYQRFRDELVVPYEESNPTHETLLKELFQTVFTTEQIDADLKSPLWKDIGFQSTNPRTDFRGAGLLGLQSLRFFTLTCPADFAQMRKCPDFFIAISCFNVTHHLIVYLYMNN